MLLLFVLAAIGLAAWALLRDEGSSLDGAIVERRGEIMGTSYAVKLAPVGDETELAALWRAVEAELREVDERMSTYRADSELSRLNASPAGEHEVSDELATVLVQAREVFDQSEGAFDPTVGPLVDAWGFGPVDVESPPSAPEIERLRAHVGFDKLELRGRRLQKPETPMRIDLSAIAKGYAVDRVAARLDAEGIENYMIEVGGEVRTMGQGPQGPWRIGIEEPAADAESGRAVHRVVVLSGVAMATSGDYRNYRENGGTRISHTIDPRTGRPIAHDLASVSVVHESCAMADAWATALDVLGAERGAQVATARGLAAYFIVTDGEGLSTLATPAFQAMIQAAP